MSTLTFQTEAAKLSARLSGSVPHTSESFSRVAADSFAAISASIRRAFGDVAQQQDHATQHDAEWQRVNSYIADVLKDAHVLYSKLARLQGDFIGGELDELEKISSDVLDLGEKLSMFMKAFHEGDANMMKEKTFGSPGQGQGGAPPGTPPPQIPAEFQRPDEDFETELDLEGDGDFEGFDDEEEQQQQQD